jgi:hypothetical protein
MATRLHTKHHRWVKYVVEPGDVIVAPDGTPCFVERPGQPVGEQVGCFVCSEPLTNTSAVTDCLGFETTASS